MSGTQGTPSASCASTSGPSNSVTGCPGGAYFTYSLTSYCYAGITAAIPTNTLYYPLGAAATAFIVLAFLCGLPALVLSGVSLQRAGARTPGAAGDVFRKLLVPALNQHVGECATLPCALVGLAWAVFVCSLIGLSVGIAMFSVYFSAYLNPIPGLTFPARGATAAATIFSLAAAVIATVLADRCCSCRRPAGGALSSAPALQHNPVLAAMQHNPVQVVMQAPVAVAKAASLPEGWVQRVTEGGDTYYEHLTIGTTTWDRPTGA